MTSRQEQRQRLIADWLRAHRIGSQEELVARLALAGIGATQATVSRDLDELGAVKSRRDGRDPLRPARRIDPGQAAAKLDRMLAEWVDAIVTAGNLLVVRTPPGSANLVANAIDAARLARNRRDDRRRRHDFRRAGRRGRRPGAAAQLLRAAGSGTEPRRAGALGARRENDDARSWIIAL